MGRARRHTVPFFGVDICALSMAQTVDAVQELMLNHGQAQHGVVNAAKIVAMQRDRGLGRILRQCDMVSADGQSVVWASRLLGRALPERVTGIDLMAELLKSCEQHGHSVYFVGAKPDVLEKFVAAVRRRYPALRIAGHHHGYFDEQQSRLLVGRIRRSAPDLLFVGMDTPRKEYWLSRNLNKLHVPFSMGVGGAFDVWAGRTRRAPRWVQSLGLEWLFRLAQDPRRLWRRYLVDNAVFVFLVAKELWRTRVLPRREAASQVGAQADEVLDEQRDEQRLAA